MQIVYIFYQVYFFMVFIVFPVYLPQVTEFLSLPGHPSVFAIGDCSATPGHKLGVYAMKQAELVVANIVKEISGSWCHPSPWTLVTPFNNVL